MAAVLESPLVSSPQNMMLLSKSNRRNSSDSRMGSTDTHVASLNSNTFESRLSPIPQQISPSDVGPSPGTSTGTETTEIEDEDEIEQSKALPCKGSVESLTSTGTLKNIDTINPPQQPRSNSDDEVTSVIHAPEGYGSFGNIRNSNPPPPRVPSAVDRSTPTPYDESEDKKTPTAFDINSFNKDIYRSPISPPLISTDIAPLKFGFDTATPRAQTRQEIDAFTGEKSSLHPNTRSSSGNLEGIPEDHAETEGEVDFEIRSIQNAEESTALKTALDECWTLCNTLASLSSIHRERIFSSAGEGDIHEQAWKCCWKLCQELYNSRGCEEPNFEVRPTLDLCRDFCQALFNVRLRDNEVADSVLRVSFELNNHLYNTHDRKLPEAFRERTLDFYVTLCHRLMKQRSGLAEETDSLLRACWSLAEMLFSLRQNRRNGKVADEELLGSAVQACWELCDLFREGWTQVRPDRGTPRANQTSFTQAFDQMPRSGSSLYQPQLSSSNKKSNDLTRSLSLIENPGGGSGSNSNSNSDPRPSLPETPTTEFEDTPISPEDYEDTPQIPNILILGTESSNRSTNRWSSALSQFSQSQGSNKSSRSVTTTSTATATTAANPESVNLTILN